MKKIILSVGICAVVLIVVIFALQLSSKNADTRIADEVTTVTETEEQPTLEISETSSETTETITVPATNKAPVSLEDDMLVIGEKDAPVTILEFSSLTCPHCATFHRGSLPAIKADYVDTGKVKIIFHDFPLNKPAMAGSLLLKCIDVNKRYDFMDMLFEQQSAWAFDEKYETKLKQYAALLGLSNEKAEACMNNADLEKDIIQNMRANAEEFSINATPSFVILPGKDLVVGPQSYGTFATKIEAILSEQE